MGGGVRDQLAITHGFETTWGDGVTATAKGMGITEFKPKPVIQRKVFKTIRGVMGPGTLNKVMMTGATATVNLIQTYEDLHFIETLMGTAAPSGTGTYTRDYAADDDAFITPSPLTVYYYSEDAGYGGYYRMAGATGKKVTFKASSNTELTASYELFGKVFAATDSTAAAAASLNERTVEPVTGNEHSLYIDAFGGTCGATAITPDAYSMELTIESARDVNRYMGSAAPTAIKDDSWTGNLKMTLEFNAGSKAYLEDMIDPDESFRVMVRNKFTNGTSTLQFDFAGIQLEPPEPFTNQNGMLTLELNLTAMPTADASLANWFKMQSVNTVAVLP